MKVLGPSAFFFIVLKAWINRPKVNRFLPRSMLNPAISLSRQINNGSNVKYRLQNEKRSDHPCQLLEIKIILLYNKTSPVVFFPCGVLLQACSQQMAMGILSV